MVNLSFFKVSFLEKDVTRREAVNKKIADPLKFEEGQHSEQKLDLIKESIVFVKAINRKPLKLYYPIHWSDQTYKEDICEPGNGITNLQQLFKKHQAKNLKSLTATSPFVDKDALLPLIATHSGQKVNL